MIHKLSSCYEISENSENMTFFKILKVSFSEFRKNRFVILARGDHAVSDPLVAVQLDASNAFCSVSRQPQFDVWAGKASRSYDDGRVHDDDCFYYHSWRNNVVIAFGTLSSFLT